MPWHVPFSLFRIIFVDPPGLEPGLCGTKIRRVANYTMGHPYLIRCCKIIIKNLICYIYLSINAGPHIMLTAIQTASVVSLLHAAGTEILRIYRMTDYGVKVKEDDSPVTAADLASDSIIKSGLQTITPSIPVYSEETKDVPFNERSRWNPLWLLDPLDGTKEFIARSDEFCISLALIKDNEPVAGFVYAPVTAETWVAGKGQGAYLLAWGKKIALPFTSTIGPFHVNISRTHHSKSEAGWIENFKKENDIVIDIYGSAIKFCKMAEGRSDLYPKFSLIHEWDIAAGHIIINESGGRIIEPDTGRPPIYNKEDYHQPPFIAFGPRIRDWQKWISAKDRH